MSALIAMFLAPMLLLAGVVFRRPEDSRGAAFHIMSGFALVASLCGIISALFQVSVSTSFWITLVFLMLYGFMKLVRRKMFSRSILLGLALFELTTGSILEFFGSRKSPFGSSNFDFLYNVVDGVFLRNHSTNVYEITQNVNPLTWSADAMGRFAPSYFISALTPLHLNAPDIALALYAICIVGSTFLLFEISKVLIRTSSRVTLTICGSLAVLSPLALQSWHYALFGQTSGLPILLCLVLIGSARSRSSELLESRRLRWEFIFLLGSLYWIYPAHFLFAAVTTVAVLLLWKRTELRIDFFSMAVDTIIMWLLMLVVPNIHQISVLGKRIAGIFSFTAQGHGGANFSSLVFNQYSSHLGPLISTGLLSYPFQGSRVVLMLGYAALIYLILLPLLHFYYKSKNRLGLALIDHVFLVLTSGYFLIFFLSRSNYLLFKISSWIQPVVYIAYFSFVSFLWSNSHGKRRLFLYASIFPVILVMVSSISNISTIVTSKDNSFRYSHLKLPVNSIVNYTTSARPLLIAAPSAEDVAWLAINLPTYRNLKLEMMGVNIQELNSSFSSSCETLPVAQNNQNVGWFKNTIDIFPEPRLAEGAIVHVVGTDLAVTTISNVESLVVGGYGLFYPERSLGWPVPRGKNFRWSSGRFSFYVWSRASEVLNLKFDLAQGPDGRSPITLSSEKGTISISKPTGSFQTALWKDISVKAGWNCLAASAPENSALISSNSSRADFRTLLVAIGDVTIM